MYMKLNGLYFIIRQQSSVYKGTEEQKGKTVGEESREGNVILEKQLGPKLMISLRS